MSKLIIDYNHTKQPDFIGDIHGHFDALVQLFEKMGYTERQLTTLGQNIRALEVDGVFDDCQDM
jgi:hypothetical protein